MSSDEISVTTIDLLRHGQTVADDILRGRIDVPLSEAGYQQMVERIAPLIEQDFPWQRLITSPLQRCARFAEELAQQHDAELSVDHGFLEMDFGDWDGRTLEELEKDDASLFTRIWRDPTDFGPPNGEAFADFAQRIVLAWDALLEQHRGEHILLISHGGVIRALLSNVMDTPITSMSRIQIPYACLSRVRIFHQPGEEHWPQLIFHNPQAL